MPNYFCGCPRCTWNALIGPLLLITLGTLFAIDHAGYYRFSQTWPVLLILYGLFKAVAYMLPTHASR